MTTDRTTQALNGEASRSKPKGWVFRVVGVVILLIGVLSTPLLARFGGAIGGALLGALAFLAVSFGSTVWTTGRKHLARTAQEAMIRSGQRPVLYLRSFQADDVAARPVGMGQLTGRSLTEEEHLARALKRIGPLVAIGKPGEKLPELGAARLYVSDDEWRQKVSALMEDARLVVLRAGESQGFWWEVEWATKHLRPEQLVFLVPYDATEYEAFSRRLSSFLPRPLPAHIRDEVNPVVSIKGVIYFEPDWTPNLLIVDPKAKNLNSMKAGTWLFMRTLRPVFAQLNIRWPGVGPGGNWPASQMAAIVLLGVLGLLFVLAALSGA